MSEAKRILVVEDDQSLRVVIRMVLEQARYEVLEARHGIAALELMENEIPDVVIADLRMPLMNGVDLRVLDVDGRARARHQHDPPRSDGHVQRLPSTVVAGQDGELR